MLFAKIAPSSTSSFLYRIGVIPNIEAYQKLLDEMDEFLQWKWYQQAVEETDLELANGDFVTLDSYLAPEV